MVRIGNLAINLKGKRNIIAVGKLNETFSSEITPDRRKKSVRATIHDHALTDSSVFPNPNYRIAGMG